MFIKRVSNRLHAIVDADMRIKHLGYPVGDTFYSMDEIKDYNRKDLLMVPVITEEILEDYSDVIKRGVFDSEHINSGITSHYLLGDKVGEVGKLYADYDDHNPEFLWKFDKDELYQGDLPKLPLNTLPFYNQDLVCIKYSDFEDGKPTFSMTPLKGILHNDALIGNPEIEVLGSHVFVVDTPEPYSRHTDLYGLMYTTGTWVEGIITTGERSILKVITGSTLGLDAFEYELGVSDGFDFNPSYRLTVIQPSDNMDHDLLYLVYSGDELVGMFVQNGDDRVWRVVKHSATLCTDSRLPPLY